MGILNITPDSFYKGYLRSPMEEIMRNVVEMIQAGADVIDIGGQSTRPGSERVSEDEEMERVMPVIKHIRNKFPDTILSIDTYYSSVAENAVAEGVSIVNDISGGAFDAGMIATVAKTKAVYVCMHIKGTPETMQVDPQYENILAEITDYFSAKIKQCTEAGIKDIIIDPGFGFGKTISQNLYLLKNLSTFHVLGKPVLAGLSRKGTIYKTLNISPEESLNGSTVMHTIALMNGASILRVHDVKEAREAVLLMEAYKNAASI